MMWKKAMRDVLLVMPCLGLLASSAVASGYGIDVGPLANLDAVALEVTVGETLANPRRGRLPGALFEGEPEEARAFEASVLNRVAKVLRKGGLRVTDRASPHWLHLAFLGGGYLADRDVFLLSAWICDATAEPHCREAGSYLEVAPRSKSRARMLETAVSLVRDFVAKRRAFRERAANVRRGLD